MKRLKFSRHAAVAPAEKGVAQLTVGVARVVNHQWVVVAARVPVGGPVKYPACSFRAVMSSLFPGTSRYGFPAAGGCLMR